MALLGLSVASHTASAATRTVPSQYPTIQAALNACADGDRVLISDGTYAGPGNVDLEIGDKKITVEAAGGDPSKTLIDCGGPANGHRAFRLQSRHHPHILIRGLTIQNGSADPGGAIDNENATLEVKNCVFYNCAAIFFGGAVYNGVGTSTLNGCSFIGNSANYGAVSNAYSDGVLTVTGCRFSQNVGTEGAEGSALYNTGLLYASNCLFDSNSNPHGGGTVENYYGRASLTNCAFQNNYAVTGGGVENQGLGVIRLTGCAFNGNVTFFDGGAFRNFGTAVVANCEFSRNVAHTDGGGIENYGKLSLTGCTLTDNEANLGGGIDNEYNALARVTNCDFVGNKSYNLGGGAYDRFYSVLTLTNDIFWDNVSRSANQIDTDLYSGFNNPIVKAAYCDILGGYIGQDNVNADPLFLDAAAGDYHLKSGSPCAGMGTRRAPAYLPYAEDYQPRPNPPSIGAFEVESSHTE